MASAIGNLGRALARQTAARCPNKGSNALSLKYFHLQNVHKAEIKIDMPSLSPTMTEGTIVKWYKKEGDPVVAGDVLCDIQTDKAVVAMDTDEDGTIAKIIMPENSQNVLVGTLIAMMVEEGDDWKNVKIPESSTTPTATPGDAATPASDQATHQPTTTANVGPIGPAVRKLMEEYDITASSVNRTGPHGRLMKGDVLSHIKSLSLSKKEFKQEPTSEATPSHTQPPSATSVTFSAPLFVDGDEVVFEDIQLTGMRKTIAKRLTESKTTIPHSYVTMECNIGAATKLRKSMIANGQKVSMNDFIIKASALALQRVPKVNSVWQGDRAQMTSAVDICVAVATDQGLITPIVKNPAFLPFEEISSAVKDLAGRAREGKLQLHEFQGGSFTISNLGMFGISEFTAVINPPQVAIMAVGGSRLVLGLDGTPQTNLTVSVSYDSRVVDEMEASQFLEVFRDYMENPKMMEIGAPKSMNLADSL